MTSLFVASILINASVAFGGTGTPQAKRVIHVDARASGADTGRNWRDAHTSLQAALAVATPGDEIWVAEGIYRPTAGDDRSATFALVDGVAVLGGFAGAETDRGERKPEAHPTILSGNVGAADDDTDDSIHVVTAGATAGRWWAVRCRKPDGQSRHVSQQSRRVGRSGLRRSGKPDLRQLHIHG